MSAITNQPAPKDPLLTMIEEIPRDSVRIKQMKGDPAEIKTELTGTVLSYLLDLANSVKEIREWASESIIQLGSDMDEFETRISLVEGGDTQITPDDAEKFVKLIAGAKWMASELLKHGQTNEGTQKLKEFVALAEECEAIVNDSVLMEDEEEEDSEDEDDESEEEEKH